MIETYARRGFLLGLMVAPAIVRASSIMPVRPWSEGPLLSEDYLIEGGPYFVEWRVYDEHGQRQPGAEAEMMRNTARVQKKPTSPVPLFGELRYGPMVPLDWL